jgi:hypothetical protein
VVLLHTSLGSVVKQQQRHVLHHSGSLPLACPQLLLPLLAVATAARFDGDGMVHAVRIKDGAASYCNRWVPTSRLAQVRIRALSSEGQPIVHGDSELVAA